MGKTCIMNVAKIHILKIAMERSVLMDLLESIDFGKRARVIHQCLDLLKINYTRVLLIRNG